VNSGRQRREEIRLQRRVRRLPRVTAEPARRRRWRERLEAHAEPGVRRWAAWAGSSR